MMRLLIFVIPLLCLTNAQVFTTKESVSQIGAGSSPIIGPCTIGVHAEGGTLRCTENGYFELVQCNREKNYCTCVNPLTGEEAKETRTGSAKITPHCGNCHFDVSRRVTAKTGLEVTIDKRMLQCNSDNGKYRRVQCQNTRKCFCVDEITGASIRDGNDVREVKSVKQLNCSDDIKKLFSTVAMDRLVGRVAASVDPSTSATDRDSFVLANSPLSSKSNDVSGSSGDKSGGRPSLELVEPPVADPVCRFPKHVGKMCNDSGRRSPVPSVQWYFDTETFECVAFRYNGCGGNANRFVTISECWHRCKLADFGGCAGLKKPAIDAKGENIICWSNGLDVRKCPTGYRCTMLAFFGVCCHTETQELYKHNYLPICEASGVDGRPAPQSVKINASTSGGVPAVLLGKSCDDYFCPEDSLCHKKEIFAHCCY